MNNSESTKTPEGLKPRSQASSYNEGPPGHKALRKGRVSLPHADYFLTLCTQGRRQGLEEVEITQKIWRIAQALNTDKSWRLRCGVVMTDHVHLLVTLGARLSLGQAVGRLKAKTAPAMKFCGLHWQKEFFDHRLRPSDPRIDVFLYIYLNPYRARLCANNDSWPGYFCSDKDWAWLRTCLDESRPHPDWLQEPACGR